MKQHKILSLLAALCTLFFASCVDYEDPALYTPTVTTGSAEAASITRTEGTITATIISPDVKTIKKAGFRYSQFETMEVATEVKSTIEGQNIKALLSNLETGKTYYYYAFASGGFNEVRGQVQSFATKQYDAPVLGKVSIADIGESSLNASASLIDNGGDALNAAGFLYRAYPMSEPDPVPSHTSEEWQLVAYKDFASISNGSAFSELIENLEPNTEYALSAFATNKASLTGYSEVVRFRTEIHTEAPSVNLVTLVSVDETEMQLTSSIIATGNKEVTERGFCYSTSSLLPTTEDSYVKATGNDEQFQTLVSGLTPGQKYYVRAYAINEKGTGYSSAALDVTTPKYDVPVLSVTTMTNIVENSALATAYINSTGNTNITECGFCISESNKEPGKNDRVVYVTTASSRASSMESAPDYKHVASNAKASYLLAESKETTPTKARATTTADDANQQISATISDLIRGTKYYIRAFATNMKGTSYGNVAEFQTADYRTVPSVALAVLEEVTETSMKLSSSVSNNGGGIVTERGFCYSFSKTSPTLDDPHSAATGNDESFKHQFIDLIPGRKYYVRAYATNEKGTGYSDAAIEVTTITPEFFLATIGEISMSEVKEVSAIATASILDKGNTGVVLSGFCMSQTNTMPDLSDQVFFSNSGFDATISATINGLVKNTSYYLRAFVTNTVGTAYSSTKEFTTANYVAPTVDAAVLESVDFYEMTLSSSITYNGGVEVTEQGFCFSRLNNMPTLADSHLKATGLETSFQSTLTKLWPGQTYYVRAYATNERGTGYSHSALIVNTPSNGYDPTNGHDYVDLGLKDDEGHTLFWATCNVGAESPEEPGLFFAWGEVEGYSSDVSDGHVFDWANYSLCNVRREAMIKYTNNDNLIILEPEDDPATKNWGGNWRMPTPDELGQLWNNCMWGWDGTYNGVKFQGPNGNSIILPAAGYRENSEIFGIGSVGIYWTSSLKDTGSYKACGTFFEGWASDGSSGMQTHAEWPARCSGHSVRPVFVSTE